MAHNILAESEIIQSENAFEGEGHTVHVSNEIKPPLGKISIMSGVRSQFSLLNQAKKYVYLDSASTALKPKLVLDAIAEYDTTIAANVHRGLYAKAAQATHLYENARRIVADFIGAKKTTEIIFTRGTTESINIIARSLGTVLSEGMSILTSELEHHSNLIPWQMIAHEKKCQLVKFPLYSDGSLDLDTLEKTWDDSIEIVAVTQMSNVTGHIVDIAQLAALAHKHKAMIVVDAAQSIAHLSINVAQLDCDFLAFSAHKIYGPTGCGVLYGKEALLKELPPVLGGGNMISSVWFEYATYAELPHKFEAGTPPIAGAIGLAAALTFFKSIDFRLLQNHEQSLVDYAFDSLQLVPGIKIFGSHRNRGPLISFSLDGVHPHDCAQFLDSRNIAIRAGHHCAQPLMRFFGVEALSRMSFGMYTTKDDIDCVVSGLHDVRRFFL